MRSQQQNLIDLQNAEFWNEICGTALARAAGISDASPGSLRLFDDLYFQFYPYLERHIPFDDLTDRKVLEVGLGYGSVAQRIAEARACYCGLDIAMGSLMMANHRFIQTGLQGTAVRGSILQAPFGDETFDYVIAIGCYHHTGNLERALDESFRLLRAGGKAVIMIYSAYSYRRWIYATGPTFRYWCWDKLGIGERPRASSKERALHDYDSKRRAAPETVFTSISEFRRITSRWRRIRIIRENISNEGILRFFKRETLLHTLGPMCGLHLYCHLEK